MHAGTHTPKSRSRHPPEADHPPAADTPHPGADTVPQSRPPWRQTHPPPPRSRQPPPGADSPPGADTPQEQRHPQEQRPAYGLRAAGTHPTGMHSCSLIVLVRMQNYLFFGVFRVRSILSFFGNYNANYN